MDVIIHGMIFAMKRLRCPFSPEVMSKYTAVPIIDLTIWQLLLQF